MKEAVLQYLEMHRGSTVSGQELANRLGVSRAAVWKAVKALETEGHRIAAGTNKGYLLECHSDVLSSQDIRSALLPEYRDCTILTERSVHSTNTLAKQLAAEGAGNRTILLAEEQTGGRGRRGRSFYSPARTGLYMSLILRPQMEMEKLLVVTVAAAVAVCEAIEELTSCRTEIKWVNDIYLNGRKICGILTEAVSDFESGTAESVIIGIGVNVGMPSGGFPADLQGIAGSLLPARVLRNRLAAAIVNRLLSYVEELPEKAFLEAYRKRSMALGKRVLFLQDGEWREGLAEQIDSDGRLIVKTACGQIPLRAGEMKLLEKDL